MPDAAHEPRGVPIDEAPPPAWVLDHFSPAQVRDLTRSLLWTLLIYKSRGLGTPTISLAQRIYIAVHTMKPTDPKRTWLSVRTLSVELDMASTNTVTSGLRALEAAGWVVTKPRPNNGKEYYPAWPLVDCIAPSEGPERCAVATKKGVCTRRAGWGTGFDEGPCKHHREKTESGSVSQEMRHQPPAPGSMENPVETASAEPASVSPNEGPGVSPNEAAPQEMRHGVARGETEYISSTSREFDQSGVTRVPPELPEVEDSTADLAAPPAKSDPAIEPRALPACPACGAVLDSDGSCFACLLRNENLPGSPGVRYANQPS